jgi:quinol monooxygenase YgiN
MTNIKETLPEFLLEETKIGSEISITGKWVATKKSGFFRKSTEYKEMLKEWDSIHLEAKMHEGMLSTEIDPAIGQDAVLIHHIFEDSNALVNYFETTAEKHIKNLTTVAKPDIQLIRGVKINDEVRQALSAKNVKGNFGEYLFGYVKNDYQKPNPESAVQVTAKWTCKDEGTLEELIYWWQRVGTDAYSMEKGLVRFEVYQVIGENALIIHETFEDSNELQFHLTKGTAEKYKKDIDKIAFPENYFFRGPVSWLIRTYSKFMNLPATYTGQGSHYTQEGGTMSEGIINHKNLNKMANQNVMVVYKWTAKEGKSEELKSIYREVLEQMQSNEPGALEVQCYFDESSSTLAIMDMFADAGAVGFHLGTTATGHFESLLQIANPGEFLFCGNVPEEMKQAALGMGLKATFAPRISGFNRS